MLLLFVGVMVQELLLLPEASPLRATHSTRRQHHRARICDACAQQNALTEQRHLSLHDAHRVSPSIFRGARREGTSYSRNATSVHRVRLVDEKKYLAGWFGALGAGHFRR